MNDVLEVKAFKNTLGDVIAYDVSHNYSKPKTFLIDREVLQDFLRKKKMRIFWIVYGEKNIIQKKVTMKRRYDISGLYWLENGKIKGKTKFFKVRGKSKTVINKLGLDEKIFRIGLFK